MKSTRNNLLFLQSDSSNDEDPPTNENQPPHTFKIQGIHNIEHATLSKNFLAQDVHTDYTYETKPTELQLELRSSRRNTARKSQIDEAVLHHSSEQQLKEKTGSKGDWEQGISNDDPRLSEKGMEIKSQIKRTNLLTFEVSDESDESQESQQENSGQNQKQQNEESFVVSQKEEMKDSSEGGESGRPEKGLVGQKKDLIMPVDISQKTSKKLFIENRIPENSILQTTVIKSNSLGNFFYPQYDVFFNGTQNHIISGKKQMANIGSNYPISLDPQNFSFLINNYLGKVRTTKVQGTYNIFDEGTNPENLRGNLNSTKKRRSILATVCLKVGKGPRKLEVYKLKEGVSYFDLLNYPSEEPDLKRLYGISIFKDKIDHFTSRKPEWIPELKEYFLNFGGRVKQASVRNFILENCETGEEVLLFGKNDNNVYQMDISHPLTPRLALGIVLTMFDQQQ